MQEQATPEAVKEPTETEKTFFGFMRNLGADVLDIAKGIASPITDTDGFTKGIENLMYNDQGEYTTDGIRAMGGAIADRATEIVTEPVDSFYDRPLSTGLDVVGTVVPPLRGASAATGAAGAGRASSVINQAANAIESLDPFSWPATAGAVANRAGTQMGVLDDSVKRTEGVVKPKLSPRHKQSDPAYRQQVITGALDRGIDPTEKGMENLQSQLDAVTAEMNKVMREAGDRPVDTASLVEDGRNTQASTLIARIRSGRRWSTPLTLKRRCANIRTTRTVRSSRSTVRACGRLELTLTPR